MDASDGNQNVNYVDVQDKAGNITHVITGDADDGAQASYTDTRDENGNGISGSLVNSRGDMIWKSPNNTGVYMSNNGAINYIGELGGKIDASVIIPNVLAENKEIAKSMHDEKTWVAMVVPHGTWDYKNNTSTIFGYAWKYDEDVNQGSQHTEFTSATANFDDAAAFGNFNAGYTGTYAGIPASTQYTWAGLGEVAKMRSLDDMERRLKEIYNNVPPFGDQLRDYYWNTRGMAAARYGQ